MRQSFCWCYSETARDRIVSNCSSKDDFAFSGETGAYLYEPDNTEEELLVGERAEREREIAVVETPKRAETGENYFVTITSCVLILACIQLGKDLSM